VIILKKPLKFSTGGRIPADEKLLEDIPLVGEINFEEFKTSDDVIKGKPIVCSNCGAIVTNIRNIQTDSKIGSYFNCQFCSSVIVIDPKDLPDNITDTTEWVMAGKSFGKGIQKGNALIAALDVSGSMSGAKIEGVKHSLISTLKAYSKEKSDAIFGIITFESSLRIYSPDGEVIEQIIGDTLYDKKAIEKQVASNSWVKNQLPKMNIKNTNKAWQETVQRMQSLGGTALGPAVVAAKVMNTIAGTGRIFLLTDGMANEGLGSLSSSSPGGKNFYKEISEELSKNGIILDIVGIAGQGSLELKTLSMMPEITGGDLFYVDLSELGDSFTSITSDEILGRNAKIKVIVPEEIDLSNVSGIGTRIDKIKRGEDITLGGLTKSRSIAFEFKPKKKLKKRKTVPVQIQVRYKDEEDNERVRVFNDELEVTESKEELKKDLDADLIAGYTVQRAAQVMQKDRKKSRELMSNIQTKLKTVMPQAEEAQEYLASEIEEMDDLLKEEAKGSKRAADAVQASSYRMLKKRKK
jgi:DNA-directed RNA polymerase subunit RPC12/RpoP